MALGRLSSGRLEAVVSGLLRGADRVDERRWSRQQPDELIVEPGRAAEAWATAKLAVLALAAPVWAPLVGLRATRVTSAIRRDFDRHVAELHRAMAGNGSAIGSGRVARAPAGDRYFFTSDLHRFVRGSSDAPLAQQTKALYEVALDHYGHEGWALVENGDVEDYWLVSGSTYAVVYDVVRLAATTLGRGPRARVRRRLTAEHLRRIVDNNRGIYDRIDEQFHRRGRYHRLIGNHDDPYLDPTIAAHVTEVFPGLEVTDLLVFDAPGGPVGVAAHGHHTDPWGAPASAGLGRLGTWIGSALNDAPFISSAPGTSGPDATHDLLAGRRTNRLLTVRSRLGADGLDSLDEDRLYRAFRREFGDDLPIVLFGHTHRPLASPVAPTDPHEPWPTYFNSGSGVHHSMVTGIEWDGTDDPDHPVLRVVGWHYGDGDGDIVAHRDGRPVVRRVFEPSADGLTLRVRRGAP
jgi:hypothetical protein